MAEVFSGMRDILFGYNTDIHFADGDFQVTTGIDFIEREMYKLLSTSSGDWRVSPRLGAGLVDFLGENNTREVGLAMEQYIKRNLSEAVYPGTLQVRVVPSSETSVICILDIVIDGSIQSRTPFQFDFVSGLKRVTLQDAEVQNIVSSNQYQINDISQTSRPNKYYERQRVQR